MLIYFIDYEKNNFIEYIKIELKNSTFNLDYYNFLLNIDNISIGDGVLKKKKKKILCRL